MTNDERIEGGYFIMPRSICQSSLMTMPPASFKVAVWFQASAEYKDRKRWDEVYCQDVIVKRGCIKFNYIDIVKNTGLKESLVRTALKNLKKHGMVEDITPPAAKLKRLYLIYKIKKYNYYSDQANYILKSTAQEPVTDTSNTTPKIQRTENKSTVSWVKCPLCKGKTVVGRDREWCEFCFVPKSGKSIGVVYKNKADVWLNTQAELAASKLSS